MLESSIRLHEQAFGPTSLCIRHSMSATTRYLVEPLDVTAVENSTLNEHNTTVNMSKNARSITVSTICVRLCRRYIRWVEFLVRTKPKTCGTCNPQKHPNWKTLQVSHLSSELGDLLLASRGHGIPELAHNVIVCPANSDIYLSLCIYIYIHISQIRIESNMRASIRSNSM